jgi:hypothetical protein
MKKTMVIEMSLSRPVRAQSETILLTSFSSAGEKKDAV